MNTRILLSLMAALALGQAAAVTGAGTVITNIASASYPDPDDPSVVPATQTINSNTVTTTVQAVPSLTVAPDGTAGAPFTPANYSTGRVAPGQKVAILYTLTNTGNVDDVYTLSSDADTAGLAVKFYPYALLGTATPTQAQIDALTDAQAITQLGSETDNTKPLPHTTANTARFFVVYTAPSSGASVLYGPVGSSRLASASGNTQLTDPDGPAPTGPLPPVSVTYTGSPVYDGKTSSGPQGSQNIHKLTLAGTVSGTVYLDRNKNGSQDGSPLEGGLTGVLVTLKDSSGADLTDPGIPDADPGTVGIQARTDSSGRYSFTGVPVGSYQVLEGQPAGYGNPASGPDATNTRTVTLTAAAPSGTANFADTLGSISGKVFRDDDDSGTQNGSEPGLSGVTVTLSGKDLNGATVSKTATTDSSGAYSFGDLLSSDAGGYTVTETQPTAYQDGKDTPGSGASVVSNDTFKVVLAAGTDSSGTLFGERGTAISGRVYRDTRLNGSDDGQASDPGIAGVTLTLKDGAGNTVSTAISDANGGYSFPNLPAGGYTVTETQPAGYASGPEGASNVRSVTLVAGTAQTAVSFGESLSSILGRVYDDRNDNGSFDSSGSPADSGIGGVTLALFLQNGGGGYDPVDLDPSTAGVQNTVQSGADGSYRFDGLPAGTYRVDQTQPSGFINGRENTSNSVVVSGLTLGAPQSVNFGERAVIGLDCTTLYSVNNLVGDPHYQKLQTLNTATGALNSPFSNGGFDSYAIGIDPSSKRLYAVSSATSSATLSYHDPVSGAQVMVSGTFGNGALIRRAAMNAAGVLYALDDAGVLHSYTPGAGTPFATLGALTLSTGASSSTLQGGDMAFDDKGRLWMVQNNGGNTASLWRIDVTARTATLIGTLKTPTGGDVVTGSSGNVSGVAFGPDGGGYALYLSTFGSSGLTYRVNLQSAIATQVNPTGTNTAGSADLASCFFPRTPDTFANLRLQKSVVDGKAAKIGESATFRLTLTNDGPDDLTSSTLSVSDPLPRGYTGVTSSGAGVGVSGGTVTWTAGTLARGQSKSVDLVVTVLDPASLSNPVAAPADYRNTAEISNYGGATDFNSSPNNRAVAPNEDDTASAWVSGVFLHKTVRNLGPAGTLSGVPFGTSTSTSPQDVLEYCIEARNLNAKDLGSLTVTDPIPANTTYQQNSLTLNSAARTDADDSDGAKTTLDTPSPPQLPRVIGVQFNLASPYSSGRTDTVCFKVKVN